MAFELRDYQQEAIDSLYTWFQDGGGDPIIVAPTGSGKSLIIAALCKRACTDFTDTRILVLTHVKELIQQDLATLIKYWPEARTSVYSAGLNQKNLSGQVVFAGVQSFKRIAKKAGFFDMVLVDEAHLIPRNSDTTYRKVLDDLATQNPSIKLVGFTATPYRLDSGRLDEGAGAPFQGIAYDIPVADLVKAGHLAPLISKKPKNVFDTSGLHTRGGEYIDKEMADRFDTEDLNAAIVEECLALGPDRKHWIAFCISVEHAQNMAAAIREAGRSCEVVTGNTPAGERKRIIEDFKAGRLSALSTVNVLSTGFDAPHTDLLIMARPTQSTGLYIQQAGRGMRNAPGKENCLVLDFAGNVLTHGPVDDVSPQGKKAKEEGDDVDIGEAPSKVCPECNSIVHAGFKMCPDCGYEFPLSEPPVRREASTAAIMNLTAEPDWKPVQDVEYARHRKPGSPDSLRVSYLIDGQEVREWVCIEHTGYARQKAVAWWRSRTLPVDPQWPIPETLEDALGDAPLLPRPTFATLRRDGKYWQLGRVRFDRPDGDSSEVA